MKLGTLWKMILKSSQKANIEGWSSWELASVREPAGAWPRSLGPSASRSLGEAVMLSYFPCCDHIRIVPVAAVTSICMSLLMRQSSWVQKPWQVMIWGSTTGWGRGESKAWPLGLGSFVSGKAEGTSGSGKEETFQTTNIYQNPHTRENTVGFCFCFVFCIHPVFFIHCCS